MADQCETLLRRHVLDCWFPRCIDPDGGYQENFARDWSSRPDPRRHLVFQSRMLWVTATIARIRPDLHAQYTAYAEHGYAYLAELEDQVHGGYFVDTSDRSHKHSYGMAFALYALAAYYRLTADPQHLQHTLKVFEWWHHHAVDHSNGGHWDVLDVQGRPITQAGDFRPLIPCDPGLRSSNTFIHVLEALTETLIATKDPQVEDVLRQQLQLIEDTLQRQRGRLSDAYSRDWVPVDKRPSYGHEIETVMLLLDAARGLDQPSNAPLTDMAQRVATRGMDRRYGGICNSPPRLRFRPWHKQGWPQAEALLGFSVLYHRQPDARWQAPIESVWQFVSDHLVDEQHGGIFGVADRQGNVLDDRKGYRWKACYHFTRALSRVADLFAEQARQA